MNINCWKFIKKDENLIKNLKEKYSLKELTAAVLAAKSSFVEEKNISFDDYFFCNNIEDYSNLKDIEKAADLINYFVKTKKNIAIFGDYDCDGVCAAAILYKNIIENGGNVFTYIPKRSEGYGLNFNAIDFLKSKNVDLIITVDNGIVAFEEAAYIKSLGIKLIITDHHISEDRLPVADAVVNPKRKDDYSKFKDISGAFVVFKLVAAIEKLPCEEILKKYSSLVAISTIADVMPLIFENRFIVKKGLEYIYETDNLGLKNLLKLCGLENGSVSSTDLAFLVCPKLNAPGRLKDARLSFELLVCEDEKKAKKLAKAVYSCNVERKKIEEEMFKEAIDFINKNGEDENIIVVEKDDWQAGLIGLVAARVLQKFAKPAIILTKEGNFFVGSARSFEGFSIYEVLKYSSSHFVKWGGHSLAGGLTLKEENFVSFKDSVYSFCKNNIKAFKTLEVIAKIEPEKINLSIAKDLQKLAPFGSKNKDPIFFISNVELRKIVGVGKNKHVKLNFFKRGFNFWVIYFNMSFNSFYFKVGKFFDILVNIYVNDFLGEKKVEFKIVDIRPVGVSQDKIIEDYLAFFYVSYFKKNANRYILPTRDDYLYIYNIFRKNNIFYGNSYSLYLLVFERLSYFKLLVILDVFIKKSILKKDKDKIIYNKIEGKINLKDNEIINRFK